MPIYYVFVERGYLRDFSIPKKFYAQSKSKREMKLREFFKKNEWFFKKTGLF